MKYNPATRELFSEEGRLIRKLSCPGNKRWENLKLVPQKCSQRLCEKCDHHVTDTSALSEDELITLLRDRPDTCINIRLDQDNISIIGDGLIFLSKKRV